MSEDREYYIEIFKKAKEKGTYYLYDKNPEKMTLEELKDSYMTMLNCLVDERTHLDW